jgi:Domain of Unknown Function with PDB structure (DUF3857)
MWRSSSMVARVCSALLFLLICLNVVAAEAADTTGGSQGPGWIDPGWRRTVSRYAVSFDEQGLSTTVFDFEIQALDEKGAEAISQQAIAYNSYFDDLATSDLATVKADGRVIAVDERAIHDQPASAVVLTLFRRTATADHCLFQRCSGRQSQRAPDLSG